MRVVSDPVNPVLIENHIRELVNRIANGIRVCSDRYAAFQAADREYDRAYASAYLAAEGSIKDKDCTAKLETMPEREARDVAEAAHRHADRLAKSLELELRAWQSISASFRAMYGAAGSAHG